MPVYLESAQHKTPCVASGVVRDRNVANSCSTRDRDHAVGGNAAVGEGISEGHSVRMDLTDDIGSLSEILGVRHLQETRGKERREDEFE